MDILSVHRRSTGRRPRRAGGFLMVPKCTEEPYSNMLLIIVYLVDSELKLTVTF
jgi:hypothetical protein